MTIKILKAGSGDAIILSFKEKNDGRNILIDFGNKRDEYSTHLKEELKAIKDKGEFIDLAIVTHMDEDHLSGFEFLYEDFKNNQLDKSIIKKYWFNTFSSVKECLNISARQVNLLQEFLVKESDKWNINELIKQQDKPLDILGLKITILSPNIETLKRFNEKYNDIAGKKLEDDYKEDIVTLWSNEEDRRKSGHIDFDRTLENATSIAFILEHPKVIILFLGDAIPSVIDVAIKNYLEKNKLPKLIVDFVKLSHHASRRSISMKFLELVEANNYIISTDGNKHKHPNKITIAKILMNPKRDKSKNINFIFNYSNVAENVLKNPNCLVEIENEKTNHKFTFEAENYEHGYKYSID